MGLLQVELHHLAGHHPKGARRLVSPKRFGPYLSIDGQGQPYIDRVKVRRAEQVDGRSR